MPAVHYNQKEQRERKKDLIKMVVTPGTLFTVKSDKKNILKNVKNQLKILAGYKINTANVRDFFWIEIRGHRESNTNLIII